MKGGIRPGPPRIPLDRLRRIFSLKSGKQGKTVKLHEERQEY